MQDAFHLDKISEFHANPDEVNHQQQVTHLESFQIVLSLNSCCLIHKGYLDVVKKQYSSSTQNENCFSSCVICSRQKGDATFSRISCKRQKAHGQNTDRYFQKAKDLWLKANQIMASCCTDIKCYSTRSKHHLIREIFHLQGITWRLLGTALQYMQLLLQKVVVLCYSHSLIGNEKKTELARSFSLSLEQGDKRFL